MTTIIRSCSGCQKNFEADMREVRRGNANFCSRSCGSSKKRKPDPEPNQKCSWCHKMIFRRTVSKSGLYFCSVEHQSLSYGSPNIPLYPGPKPLSGHRYQKPPYKCSWLFGCPSATCKYYCKKHEVIEDLIFRWLSGDSSATWQGKYKQTALWVKRILVWMRGDRCEVCGFEEKHPTFGTSIIQMDHQDGDSTNNLISNLRLLCPNHHAMTDTYGSRNKATGRHYRRMSAIMEDLAEVM